MGISNAVLISKQSAAEFGDDDLDWLVGEIEHAIGEATKRGLLLYEYDPDLALAALDFFRRYHERLDLGQEKVRFESIRPGVLLEPVR